MRPKIGLVLLFTLACACAPDGNIPSADAGLSDAGENDAGLAALDFRTFPEALLQHLPSPDTPDIAVEYLGQDFDQRLTLDVPQNTLAFTLVLIDFDASESLEVISAVDPQGNDRIARGDRVFGNVYRTTALIPNDLGGAEAGGWQIQTQSFTTTHAFVVYRLGDVAENVSLNIAFINNTTRSIDEQVDASLSALTNAFANANISLGRTDLVDAALPLSQPLRLVGEDCALSESDLKALNFLDLPRHVLPVVVVDRFVCEAGNVGGLVGITTGIPGLPGAATDAVFVQDFEVNLLTQAESALLVAHEVGHFLGLFHLTDGPGLTDNLSDTAVEDDNLMESGVSLRNDEITPLQSRVMRGSPWVMRAER